MAAIFDLSLILISRSILISSIVLLDTKNVGVAVGMSFLSSIEAEIYDIHTYFRFTAANLIFR